jgi:hypothetical protein
MLSVIAYENHRRRSDVRRMIECYGLFIIEGDRFSSHWMQKQLCKTASSMHENGITPARSYNTGAGNRVIENKKEKKKKCVCLEDTHTTFSDTPRPLSEFETVRDGRRYASHGQPLPLAKLERMKTGTYRRVCNHCKWIYYVRPSRYRRIIRELSCHKAPDTS